MKSSTHGCTASSLHAPGGGAEGWLREVQSAFSAHHDECTQQVHKVGVDLARLQRLLDDAMSKLADAFSELASGQNPGAEAGARPVEVVVTTLQYHDICLQLLEHLRQRLEQTGRLIDQLRLPFEAVAAAAKGEASLRSPEPGRGTDGRGDRGPAQARASQSVSRDAWFRRGRAVSRHGETVFDRYRPGREISR